MSTKAGCTKAGIEAWELISGLFFSGEGFDRFHRASDAIGMSPGVMKGLLHLEVGVGMSMRDLADKFGCDASYVTGLVDGLEEKGFAIRQPHPTDRRVKTVVLTELGAAAKLQAFEVLYEPPLSFSSLSAADQKALRDLIRKIATSDPTRAIRAGAPPKLRRGSV